MLGGVALAVPVQSVGFARVFKVIAQQMSQGVEVKAAVDERFREKIAEMSDVVVDYVERAVGEMGGCAVGHCHKPVSSKRAGGRGSESSLGVEQGVE